jgi:hypothetical protein
MKNTTAYQTAKTNALQSLRSTAKEIRKEYPTDKPAQCMYINDAADAISKDLPPSMADHERERITKALHDLSGRLHPKG